MYTFVYAAPDSIKKLVYSEEVCISVFYYGADYISRVVLVVSKGFGPYLLGSTSSFKLDND